MTLRWWLVTRCKPQNPRARLPTIPGKEWGAQAFLTELASVENQSLQGVRLATARSWELGSHGDCKPLWGSLRPEPELSTAWSWATRNSRLDSTYSAATTSTPSQALNSAPCPAPSADWHFSIAWKLGQKSDLSAPALVATLGLPLKIYGIFLRVRSCEQDSALH